VQIFQARLPAVQGRLRQAAAMCEALVQAAGQAPLLCLAYYDLATIHLEWNHLPQAWENLEKGLVLAQRSANAEFIQAGALLKAMLAHTSGDSGAALAALQEAERLAQDFPAAVRSRTAAFGVQIALARRDPQLLAYWQALVEAPVDAHSFYRFIGLTEPRLLLAQGQKERASGLLAELYATAARSGWGYVQLVIRLLQCQAAPTSDQALSCLADTLRLGQPEGFIHSFVEAGSALVPLLQAAARRGVEPGYVGLILAALGVERSPHSQEPAMPTGLVEPLSARELEVLRLVMAGLSNREIAEKLFVSPGTAKTHIHNLCGKLGVRNRTEAAMKAQELRLV
jgi:LuxR family maltose regulon positive regulatory protein